MRLGSRAALAGVLVGAFGPGLEVRAEEDTFESLPLFTLEEQLAAFQDDADCARRSSGAAEGLGAAEPAVGGDCPAFLVPNRLRARPRFWLADVWDWGLDHWYLAAPLPLGLLGGGGGAGGGGGGPGQPERVGASHDAIGVPQELGGAWQVTRPIPEPRAGVLLLIGAAIVALALRSTLRREVASEHPPRR